MLKIITDGSGNVTTDGYDAVRRLTSTTFPEGAVERYTYRAEGLCLAKIPYGRPGARHRFLIPLNFSLIRGSSWRPTFGPYPLSMFRLVRLAFGTLGAFLRSRTVLVAENVALRHQLGVLLRSKPAQLPLTSWDRALWAFVIHRFPGWRQNLVIVRPETVIAWHRQAFRLFWKRKSEAGRPRVLAEVRRLIRQMATDNPTWGAPRIHGELLKLGFDVSERTISRYVEPIRPEPRWTGSQNWSTFLRNQAKAIVAVDLFTVPTVRFEVLYVFVVLALERRRLVFANVTTSPTAFWLGQQTVNAFPWDTAPKFMIRDRDGAYGEEFSRRIRSLGIRSVKTAVRVPKMNCYVERFIGTIRRELFDHVIVSSEAHARRLLREFQAWYNEDRVHLALAKDAPDHRPVETPEMGEVVSLPRLGGLHHRYSRRAA
jgi:putative transposase